MIAIGILLIMKIGKRVYIYLRFIPMGKLAGDGDELYIENIDYN